MPNASVPAAAPGLPPPSYYEFLADGSDPGFPSIAAGGMVLIDTSDRTPRHEPRAFAIEGERGRPIVRRLMLLASGRVVVMSENEAPQDVAADAVKVLGRVLSVQFEFDIGGDEQ